MKGLRPSKADRPKQKAAFGRHVLGLMSTANVAMVSNGFEVPELDSKYQTLSLYPAQVAEFKTHRLQIPLPVLDTKHAKDKLLFETVKGYEPEQFLAAVVESCEWRNLRGYDQSLKEVNDRFAAYIQANECENLSSILSSNHNIHLSPKEGEQSLTVHSYLEELTKIGKERMVQEWTKDFFDLRWQSLRNKQGDRERMKFLRMRIPSKDLRESLDNKLRFHLRHNVVILNLMAKYKIKAKEGVYQRLESEGLNKLKELRHILDSSIEISKIEKDAQIWALHTMYDSQLDYKSEEDMCFVTVIASIGREMVVNEMNERAQKWQLLLKDAKGSLDAQTRALMHLMVSLGMHQSLLNLIAQAFGINLILSLPDRGKNLVSLGHPDSPLSWISLKQNIDSPQICPHIPIGRRELDSKTLRQKGDTVSWRTLVDTWKLRFDEF